MTRSGPEFLVLAGNDLSPRLPGARVAARLPRYATCGRLAPEPSERTRSQPESEADTENGNRHRHLGTSLQGRRKRKEGLRAGVCPQGIYQDHTDQQAADRDRP